MSTQKERMAAIFGKTKDEVEDASDVLDDDFEPERRDSSSTSEEEESSHSGSDATDPSKAHADVETRDEREDDAIRQHEYRAQSSKHQDSRAGSHGADPWKRMLWDHVEAALDRFRAEYAENRKSRRKNAPFRVQLRDPKTKKTAERYLWHGEDIMELICDCIIPIAKGKLEARVQKRVSDNQEWHASPNQPHKCAIITPEAQSFGLHKMIETYRWDPWKTRLPELCEAKALA